MENNFIFKSFDTVRENSSKAFRFSPSSRRNTLKSAKMQRSDAITSRAGLRHNFSIPKYSSLLKYEKNNKVSFDNVEVFPK